ncbi:hypothetical protein Trydic_g15600 [Trypoxylus dichotomus]
MDEDQVLMVLNTNETSVIIDNATVEQIDTGNIIISDIKFLDALKEEMNVINDPFSAADKASTCHLPSFAITFGAFD